MTIEDLTRRVDRLESDVQQIRDWRIDTGLQAQAYGLSLVHADTQHLRAELAEVKTDIAEIRTLVNEVLDRLPPPRGSQGA